MPEGQIALIATVALAGLVGLLGTWAMRGYALRRELLDRPNERSSHTVPTPRGGGIAIVAGFALAATGWTLASGDARAGELWLALVPPALLVACVGFVDDHRPLSARLRLLAHFVAAAWAVGMLGGLPAIPLPAGPLYLGAAGTALAIVGTVWCLNLYNFMDGIDGIAASEAVFVALAAAMLGGPGSAAFVPLLALAAASAGFLVFNWPPARIFMGDVGSGFLGLALAGLLLAQQAAGDLPIGAAIVLLGVFLSDATATLLVRLLRGDRIHEAHRSHAYQRAARRFGGHRPVTVAVIAIDLLWLLPLAWLAARFPGWSLPVAAAALGPLSALALALGAGRPDAGSDKA
ncbi:glycosyltransferase family 4 protein [Burkholderiaceae bacterium FT117]|uniref:MraY family glycosyltransferase n=1 Tax=Zeimonas sediminis TaxID=2944268 RepID=UPI0023430684|nr:glycosyltransferase family 4 protein [Zeimonas sediminis]MCM5572386.1 glycosyltransferase family 4 protein [Zeimonas sediminis]